MKRLTTLALLAGMLSAPALHSEEPGSGAAAPLSFPQLKTRRTASQATNLRLPRRRRAPLRQPPPPPAMRRRRPLRRLCRTYPRR